LTDALRNWTNLGVNFDGLMLDMNEATSFCEGSCGTGASVQDLGNTSTPFILPGDPGNLVQDYPEW
jgi:alpha-glucosidase